MKKLLAFILSIIFILNISKPVECEAETNPTLDATTAGIVWSNCDDEVRKTLPIEYQAHACGITVEEFTFMARVIQAESNGTYDWSDLEDKILIACVILNRVESRSFNNTITTVLTQSGQFTTVSGGGCSCGYSDSSRWAIVEAQRRLINEEVPTNLLYFNSIGYASTPYCYEGGNYFSLG